MERRTSGPTPLRIKSPTERHSNLTMSRDTWGRPSQLTLSGKAKHVINCQRTYKTKREGTKSRPMSVGSESRDVIKYNLAAIFDKDRMKRRQKIVKLQEMARKLDHEADNHQHVSIKSALSSQVALLRSLRKFSFLTRENEALHSDVVPSRDQSLLESISQRSSVLQMTMHNNGPVIPAWPEQKMSSVDESLTNSEILRELAILKVRERTEAELNLPEDRSARMIKLRQNVERIQKKFATLAREDNRQDHSDAHDEEDLFGNEENLLTPSRFAQPGEVMKENQAAFKRPPMNTMFKSTESTVSATRTAKTFFRKYARIVLILLQWIKFIMNKQYDFERELKSFVDIASEIEQQTVPTTMEELGLSFDKSYYKAKKEISLSQEVRNILTTRGQYRSQNMVKQTMNGLQTLRFLSEYPLKTQEKLCMVAWYQIIEAKKTIIKQGHDAESFYLILSGNAFMKKITKDEKTKELKVHTVARLGKGQSFGFSWELGEVGLIFNTKRTATVESATPMEVLVIGKEDFIRIFMDSEQPDKEAEHIGFLRHVPLFQNWPVDSIKEEPGSCLINYFKRGTLVTDNDKSSEWFYIVKSGTCEVIKTLKAVKARRPNEIKLKEDPVSEINLSGLGMPNNGPRIDTGRRRPDRNLCRMLPPKSKSQEKSTLSSSSDENEDFQKKQSHVVVNVEILQSKDVFGLNTLLHAMDDNDLYEGENESPVMMLVSRGAEVILFSKKTFMRHMNHATLMTLKHFARYYPSESVMQDSMQTEADWIAYKNKVFKESLDNRLTRRAQSAASKRH